MAALDDYAPPVPLWLVVCRVLHEHPEGLSVTRLAAEVYQRSGGRFARASGVSATLRKMRDDGTVRARDVARGTLTASIHTLTTEGRELFTEGAAVALDLLSTPKRRRPTA